MSYSNHKFFGRHDANACSESIIRMSSRSERNSSSEMYRILLMFNIVLGHMAWGRADGWLLLLFCALPIWHVDGFITLSGWYGIRFSLKKIINLVGVVIFYDIIRSIAKAAWPESQYEFSWVGGWFVTAYLFLMFLAPLLNAGVDALWKRSRREAVFGCLMPAVFVGMRWLRGDLAASVQLAQIDSFTIVNMATVYVIARLTRKFYDEGALVPVDLIAIPIFIIGLFAAAFVPWLKTDGLMSLCNYGQFSHYSSPHVWLMAIGGLYFFVKRVRLSGWIDRLVRVIAPSMFGVYLAHGGPHIDRIFVVSSELFDLPHGGAILIGSIAVFVFCVALDLVRRTIVKMMCGLSRIFFNCLTLEKDGRTGASRF